MRKGLQKQMLGAVGVLALTVLWAVCGAQEKGIPHIVVLADLHLTEKRLASTDRVVETVNAWPDVTLAVILGDIVEETGTPEDYERTKRFVSEIKIPVCGVNGNHDTAYEDVLKNGKKVRASTPVRKAKLQRFKDLFSLPEAYYSRKMDPYLLVFLPIDDPGSGHLCEVSGKTLDWFEEELKKNKTSPTIVFFHAPLKGTLRSENQYAEEDDFIAQPHRRIRKILSDNPQVFLWVSGHTHTAPTNARFKDKVNLYENRVMNIHNPNINGNSFLSEKDLKARKHGNTWTNSLFLHPDKVVVKTYDHKQKEWMEDLTREIPHHQ
jgi:3',5'-cyclic-AMP phosphodiesterase